MIHKYSYRFFVLEHRYGRRDIIYSIYASRSLDPYSWLSFVCWTHIKLRPLSLPYLATLVAVYFIITEPNYMRSRNRDLFPAKVRANPPLKHTQMYPSGETPKQSLREGTGENLFVMKLKKKRPEMRPRLTYICLK